LKNWVQSKTVTDSGFLRVLDVFRKRVDSSNRGTYYPISRGNLKEFGLNVENVEQRLSSIIQSNNHNSKALELLDALNQGKNSF
jgi:hypothetical protein